MLGMDKESDKNIPSAPEIGSSSPTPQLIKGTEPSKPEEPEVDNSEQEWSEEEEEDKQYDPVRGDYVEHLNDTTPAPAPAPVAKPAKKAGKRWLWPVIILALIGIAAGAYFLLGGKKAAAPEAAAPATNQQTATTTEPETPAAITTKHYDSTNFAMGLDYPDDWKLNDTETLLTVTSPQMTFTTNDDKQAKGYIRVTVQPKQTSLPDFSKGSATAVIESNKIAYKKPTQNQRAQTYLTFASYFTTKNNGWDAIYITGDNGYQVGQTIPQADILQPDPLVTVKFLACTSQECAGTATPLSLNVSEWKKTTVSEPIKTILQSFSFN